jgi:hypothetical protein
MGSLLEGIDLYDDWGSDYYSVDRCIWTVLNQTMESIFYPPIPGSWPSGNSNYYKNHLNEEISEKEVKGLYEYSEEIYEGKRLIKKRKYTAHSGKDLKEQKYKTLTSSYYDDIKEVPDLEIFNDNSDKIYYNRRSMNHYILYDLLQETIGKENSRIFRNCRI